MLLPLKTSNLGTLEGLGGIAKRLQVERCLTSNDLLIRGKSQNRLPPE
jgi:hypothetical protein